MTTPRIALGRAPSTRGQPDRTHNAPVLSSAVQVRSAIESLRAKLTHVRTGRALLLAAASALLLALALRVILLVWALVLPASYASAGAVTGVLQGPIAWMLPVLVFALVLAWQVLRWEPITSLRAALWYEEQYPAQHAVVTLVELRDDELAPPVESQLVRQAAISATTRVPGDTALRESRRRAWQAPLATSLGAMIALLLVVRLSSPQSLDAIADRGSLTEHGGTDGSGAAPLNRVERLRNWRIEITPPSYVKAAPVLLEDSSSATGLVGSRVRITGPGGSAGLRAEWTLRGDAARQLAVDGDDPWHASLVMPPKPTIFRMTDGDASRVITLIPRADSLPLVQLRTPLRDSVYRDTLGALALTADATDDLGLGSLVFEVIVTSGAGEQYTARTLTFGRRSFTGARTGSSAHSVSFAALGIAPGDVMHVRAVARDLHPAASREAGVSETRSLRFARAGEYDSVAVEAAPPPVVDSSLLSQRMLLDLTEKLEARRARISREVLVDESRRLASEQARIRRAVSALVFQRLTGEGESEHVHYEGDGHDHGLSVQAGKLVPSFGAAAATAVTGGAPPMGASGQVNNNATDESPIVALNRPLLEAYNAMWDAGRALELADTKAAIPPMRLALEAIQRARAAERVYLRGRVRPVVVDLARVRLAGKDTGQDSRRRAGERAPLPRELFGERLLRAAEALPIDEVSARDSLVALRIDALSESPNLARALELVLNAISQGTDATEPLVRARRTLVRPTPTPGVSAWSVP